MKKMRDLSNLEKEIVNKLCAGTRKIDNIFEDYIDGTMEVDIDKDLLKLRIRVPSNTDNIENDYIIHHTNRFTEKIVIIINLLDYLIKQGYLLKYRPKRGKTIRSFYINENCIGDIKQHPENYSTEWDFTDDDLKHLLFDYLELALIATATLDEIAKYNFKTKEERRHFQDLKATWFGIMIAFLIGFTGLFVSLMSSSDKTIQIEKTQFDFIKNSTNIISNRLDSLINHANVKKDTAKSMIIKETDKIKIE